MPFTPAFSVEWKFTWPGTASSVTAEVCPLLYDKTWAYCVEIDDAPSTVSTYAVDFFARYTFTDAPPGVPGGKAMPIVGNVGLISYIIGANRTYLSEATVREILGKGWGIANHSYSHRGRTWGKVPEILSAEEMREDLFWSQSVCAHLFGGGRAPTHFIFPNGYTAYRDHFGEFGILSGSLLNGSGGSNLFDPKSNITMLNRAYLDEKNWAEVGQGDPLYGFPAELKPGRLQIDFTHGTNPDPASPNAQRWKQRMDTLSARYGKDGDDSMWSAPVQDVIQYVLASSRAQLKTGAGYLAVSLPADSPGTRLTIRLEGIPASTMLTPPEGGLLHRRGTTVWVTTPMLGLPGTPAPEPRIKRIFSGPAGVRTFEKPVRLAGVRIFHTGKPETETPVEAILTLADGAKETLGPKILKPAWGNGHLLLPVLPLRPALEVKSVEVPARPTVQAMEIWILDES